VFLGKQKYQEGMIPMLTALFDCPKEWSSATIMRGDAQLTNVAFSMLGASTLDWIQTAIPRDAFGGGFMSRMIFIVQESTSRVFPIPPKTDPALKKSLAAHLLRIRKLSGEASLTPSANLWYDKRYRSALDTGDISEKHYAGYFERRWDHLLRIGMILNVSTTGNLMMDVPELEESERILLWLERYLPSTFEEMTATAAGEDTSRILRILKKAGGQMEHTVLLRRNSSRMNGDQFRRTMGTLREAKLVEWDPVSRAYFLTIEGWR
jgi:hypothetical protein